MQSAKPSAESSHALQFEETAGLLKALGHPFRLRLACGLSREPSNLTRIASMLGAPLSTVALHLGVLRRSGILTQERSGAEVVFSMRDPRVRSVLRSFCGSAGEDSPASWDWNCLAREMGAPKSARP